MYTTLKQFVNCDILLSITSCDFKSGELRIEGQLR